MCVCELRILYMLHCVLLHCVLLHCVLLHMCIGSVCVCVCVCTCMLSCLHSRDMASFAISHTWKSCDNLNVTSPYEQKVAGRSNTASRTMKYA